MRGETQLNSIHLLCNLCKWGWNTVQYLLCNWCKWEVKLSTIFICYATCANDVKLVQMTSETQYNNYSLVMQLCANEGGTQYNIYLCNLCKWHQTCANEGWNSVQYSFVMQLVQMMSNLCRWPRACADDEWKSVQYSFFYATNVDSSIGTQGARAMSKLLWQPSFSGQ